MLPESDRRYCIENEFRWTENLLKDGLGFEELCGRRSIWKNEIENKERGLDTMRRFSVHLEHVLGRMCAEHENISRSMKAKPAPNLRRP